MAEKDLVATNKIIPLNSNNTNRFRGEKISIQNVHFYNKEQFKRVLETLEAAGMTFAEAAKAGVHLGYPVTIETKDAPIKPGNWENQPYGIKEDEHKIIAWQRRGEVASLSPQLGSPVGDMDNKIALVSNNSLTVSEQEPSEQVIEIMEGVQVIVEQPNANLGLEQAADVVNDLMPTSQSHDIQAEATAIVEDNWLQPNASDLARQNSPFFGPVPVKK